MPEFKPSCHVLEDAFETLSHDKPLQVVLRRLDDKNIAVLDLLCHVMTVCDITSDVPMTL